MTQQFLAVVSALLALASQVCLGQELQQNKTIHSDVFASAISVPAKCDFDGNLLVRVHQEEIGSDSPILKVASDGHVLLSIRLDNKPEYKDWRVLDFAAGFVSEVFVLVSDKDRQVHVLRFDSDAKLEADNILPIELQPTRLAAFSSTDTLLISGFKVVENSKQPMVGIINLSGDHFREIAVDAVDSIEVGAEKERAIRDSIAGSVIEASDDGRAWLMRRSSTGLVYSVTASGTIDKRMQLSPPAGSYLSQIKVSHGKLIAKFVRNKPDSNLIDRVILDVIDPATSRTEGEFWHSQSSIGSVLACAEPRSFTFVSTDTKGKLQITQTGP
jgi:hypothetical protein